MNGLRKEKYGLRQVDSFERAIGIKPHAINLPPLKATEMWNSPVFQALMAQQQAVETEAELDARKAQLYGLMKRVAAEKRLPIEDIKRVVNEVARGPGGGGGQRALPAPPPVGSYDMELRQGQGVLQGDAMGALMQHVQQAALVNPSVLPQELRVHSGVKAAIGAVGAETDELSIDTQAQESARAIQKRAEDMLVARQQSEAIRNLFSLENAGKAASAVGRGAYFLGTNVLLPVAQAALAMPGAVAQGSAALAGGLEALENAAGAASEGVNWMLEDSQVVREHRQRAMPYTSALEDVRYDVPMREEEEPERPARKRKVARAIEGGSSSSSSSTAVAVPSYGATAGKFKNPLRITREDVEGVIGKLNAVKDFGFGPGGLAY